MKRGLMHWLGLAVSLCFAQVTIAQALVSYTPVSDNLDSKWSWGLGELAASGGEGWIAWQVRTRLDEKIDPSASGFGDFIRWNNRSRYLNWNSGGDWRNGVSLNALLAGAESPQENRSRELDLLLVFRIKDGAPEELLLSQASRPMNWRNLPVAWLGETNLQQSFRWTAGLLDPEQSNFLKRQLIRSLGMHAVADRTGYLAALYDSEDWLGQAPYLLEGLALQQSGDVANILLDVARDENAGLTTRRVAISALGRYDDDLVLDSLVQLSAAPNPLGIRVEAIESLGMYGREQVGDLLYGLLMADDHEAVQEQALDSLAWLPGQFDAIADVAHLHGRPGIRGEALETLAGLDIDAAFRHLVQAVETDPNEKVRRQALEEMKNAPAHDAVPYLQSLSTRRGDQSLAVRREAVESLGRFDLPEVRQHLNELAWSDAQGRIRNRAVASLADLGGSESSALLLEIARSHPSADTREEALDQLTKRMNRDI